MGRRVIAHGITIESKALSSALDNDALKRSVHRWRCSCGVVGEWNSRARGARDGGAMHKRIAENPRPPRTRRARPEA